MVNGKSAGILDYRQQTTLAAGGSKTISIPIRLNPIAAITLVPILRSKAAIKNAQVTLQGTLNAEGISTTFNTPVNFG